MRSNPSLERTPSGMLRVPTVAAHVQRQKSETHIAPSPMPSRLRSLTTVSAAVVLAVAVVATGCGKKPAASVTFKANSPIPVGFTLLKADGQIGRSGAISNNYRPQVRFPRGTTETTCAVALPASSPALEPGQTTDASLACDSQVEVEPSKLEFTVFEGGKQVGQGTVQLP